MLSNTCKIQNGTMDLNEILKESERVASCCGFNEKQTLQLRLLCEEMDGMLPNIIDEFYGDFWIEVEDGTCKINASIYFAEFTAQKKKELINVSKSKTNANAKGIVGKIRSIIEDLFLDSSNMQACDMAGMFNFATEQSVGIVSSFMWSLRQYKNAVKKKEESDWDELEKSIIASLADDVIVGVKGKQANIVIIKNFK